jgi:hypothetical protein
VLSLAVAKQAAAIRALIESVTACVACVTDKLLLPPPLVVLLLFLLLPERPPLPFDTAVLLLLLACWPAATATSFCMSCAKFAVVVLRSDASKADTTCCKKNTCSPSAVAKP